MGTYYWREFTKIDKELRTIGMYFFEKYFSMYTFALVWGILIFADFFLRIFGLAGYYSIDTGLLFPIAAPVMSFIVILAFLYFLTSPNRALSKKFYSSCSVLMLMVFSSTLFIDFILRFVAFDATYCRGQTGEEFAACKADHKSAIWLDILKIAAMLRMVWYSTNVLETYRDTAEKTEPMASEVSLL